MLKILRVIRKYGLRGKERLCDHGFCCEGQERRILRSGGATTVRASLWRKWQYALLPTVSARRKFHLFSRNTFWQDVPTG